MLDEKVSQRRPFPSIKDLTPAVVALLDDELCQRCKIAVKKTADLLSSLI